MTLQPRSPVENLHKINGTPYKDWATTVKEARARKIPIGLPPDLKNYFEKALGQPPISSIFGGVPSHSYAYQHGSSHRRDDGKVSRKTVLGHVSRNNPHPFRIFFPFQTGDRLKTYMVWVPMDRGPTLPRLPKQNERTSDSRNCHSRLNGNFGFYTDLNRSTYQQEISRMPFIHRKVNMVDHFPNTNSTQRLRAR